MPHRACRLRLLGAALLSLEAFRQLAWEARHLLLHSTLQALFQHGDVPVEAAAERTEGRGYTWISLLSAWGQLLGAPGLLDLPQGSSAAEKWVELVACGGMAAALPYPLVLVAARSLQHNARQVEGNGMLAPR